MKTKSKLKKEYILENAMKVFIKKGFTSVTMTDIVNQCSISRGGLYKYYKSTEDIFIEIISHSKSNQNNYYIDSINNRAPFREIFSTYLEEKKKYLLCIKSTLVLAMYEFFLSKKNDPSYSNIISKRFDSSVKILSLILRYGTECGEITITNFDERSRQILLLLEGMYILALSSNLPESLIDNQFNMIKDDIKLK